MENIKDLLIKLTKGRQLKSDLGLDKFKYAYIQKIIDMAQDVYVVTVDSRYPTVFFSQLKLKRINRSALSKSKKRPFSYDFKNCKLTPGVLLDDFKGDISSGSLIIKHDLVTEYFRDDGMFECVDIDGIKVVRLIG